MIHRLASALIAVSLLESAATADTIHLKSGESFAGVVLKQHGDEYTIRIRYTTLVLDKSAVKSIDKSELRAGRRSLSNRLVDWEQFLDVAIDRPWITSLRAIPATVIDKGVLRSVPYMSFRSGDYELNLYGDPEKPACLEIGVYRDLLSDAAAKKNCVEFIAAMLNDPQDKATLRSLDLKKDLKRRADLTFEITPETAEDAYGGWWVSVYDEAALDKSRASKKELESIAVRKDDVKKSQPAAANKPGAQAGDKAEPADWNAQDISYARAASKSTSSAGSGSVYVRGYHRKDGTYVRPHTRRR